MTFKNQFLNDMKQGLLFYAFSTILIAIQFGFYIVGSPILDYMDLEGWVFFAASCVSHASQFALVPYLISILVLLCRCPKTARAVQIVGVVLLCVLNYLNSQVYAIYHFHINGFVLSMVFGDGASEIFNFDALLYLKEAGLFAIVATIDGHATHIVQIIAKALHGLVDLLSQLTCRTHYDTVDSVLRESAVVKTREDRQQIGSGLARTSLCYTKKVATFEYRRNTLFLYGGAYVKAHVV